MEKIRIPKYAKQEAIKAIKLRKSLPKYKKFGLDSKEASKLNINSGVKRAYQLINEDNINKETAKRIASFYSRFKNCTTPKCEGAIKLWGGRRFGKMLNKELKYDK